MVKRIFPNIIPTNKYTRNMRTEEHHQTNTTTIIIVKQDSVMYTKMSG